MTTTLTVRRLLIDLETPLPRHWAGGDAFRTAFMNALSMSFPMGEQLFIDSLKKAVVELPPEERERFASEVQGFIGQEATHRRIHQRFNALLDQQGYVNRYEARLAARRPLLERIDTRNWVAVTAATEHFTAVFSEYLLSHSELMQGVEPRIAQMWQWHCAEETEHRSTAFDLYLALGGNHAWRVRIFRTVAWSFAIDLALQTWRNLWADGSWRRPSTWASGWRTLFARGGLVREIWTPLMRYLRADFHPSQGDPRLAEQWLQSNAALVPAVKAGPAQAGPAAPAAEVAVAPSAA
jgi:predicted metal-dependent hydrolase